MTLASPVPFVGGLSAALPGGGVRKGVLAGVCRGVYHDRLPSDEGQLARSNHVAPFRERQRQRTSGSARRFSPRLVVSSSTGPKMVACSVARCTSHELATPKGVTGGHAWHLSPARSWLESTVWTANPLQVVGAERFGGSGRRNRPVNAAWQGGVSRRVSQCVSHGDGWPRTAANVHTVKNLVDSLS